MKPVQLLQYNNCVCADRQAGGRAAGRRAGGTVARYGAVRSGTRKHDACDLAADLRHKGADDMLFCRTNLRVSVPCKQRFLRFICKNVLHIADVKIVVSGLVVFL